MAYHTEKCCHMVIKVILVGPQAPRPAGHLGLSLFIHSKKVCLGLNRLKSPPSPAISAISEKKTVWRERQRYTVETAGSIQNFTIHLHNVRISMYQQVS